LTDEKTRSVTPAGWETIVPYFNHSELSHVNKLAQQAGIVGMAGLPFPEAEPLMMDNGERFFSEYLSWLKEKKPAISPDDLCLCCSCTGTEIQATRPVDWPRFRLDGPSNVLVAEEEQQQQTQQQETPQNKTNVICPLPTNPFLINMTPSPGWFMVPSAPVMWINPYMMPHTNWNHCCRKHKECCSQLDRRGRPPHDDGCRFKARNNSNIIK